MNTPYYYYLKVSIYKEPKNEILLFENSSHERAE